MTIENPNVSITKAYINTSVFIIVPPNDKSACIFLISSPANLLAFIEAWDEGYMNSLYTAETIVVCYLLPAQQSADSPYQRNKLNEYLVTLFHEVTGVELKETEVIRNNIVAKELTANIPKRKGV